LITRQTSAVVTLKTLKPQTASAMHSNSAEEAQRADWEVEDRDEAKGDGVSKERDERIKKRMCSLQERGANTCAHTRTHAHVQSALEKKGAGRGIACCSAEPRDSGAEAHH